MIDHRDDFVVREQREVVAIPTHERHGPVHDSEPRDTFGICHRESDSTRTAGHTLTRQDDAFGADVIDDRQDVDHILREIKPLRTRNIRRANTSAIQRHDPADSRQLPPQTIMARMHVPGIDCRPELGQEHVDRVLVTPFSICDT
jgi:hypothetical protein